MSDVIVDGGGLAVSYISPAKNHIGLSVGVEEGRFPFTRARAGGYWGTSNTAADCLGDPLPH